MNGDLGTVVDVEAAGEDRRDAGILGTDGDAVPVLADHDGGGVRAREDLQKVYAWQLVKESSNLAIHNMALVRGCHKGLDRI